MTSRDEELAPLIRGVFLPEEGQVWAKPDASQQEFRVVVHYANQHKLRKAADAVARYRDDPDADFHALAAAMTGLERGSAKYVNFAKIYGAGLGKFADMIGRQLSDIYTKRARNQGYITLYDGARRHFDRFAPRGKWKKGPGPCGLEEARERLRDPGHPWYHRGPLYRVDTHTALNALIQGTAARHTKLWMRACWREGIVPLLQMHDCLDCSVSSLKQAELVARLGCAAVQLDVPMCVDLKFGRTWGDAKHSWAELHVETVPTPESITHHPPIEPIETTTAAPDINNKPIEIPVPATAFQQSARQIERANNEAPSMPPGRNEYQSEPRNKGRPIAAYIYRQIDGTPYLRVLRTTTKAFLQFHWEGGQWVSGKPKGPKIPYRLPELLAAAPTVPVFVCEGEKDADNVAALGLVASASAEGAGKWTADLNKWFAGKQTVYILEDNDAAGRSHAAKVATALQAIDADIHIVSFPELPEHGDVSDWLDMGGTRTELLERAQAAPHAQPNGYVLTRASDIVPRPLDWLWRGHLLRGSQELLTGIPGGGKSQIHCALVAYVTTGGMWPDGCNGIPAGNVIMLTAEEAAWPRRSSFAFGPEDALRRGWVLRWVLRAKPGLRAWRSVFDGIWACASLLHVPQVALPDVLGRFVRALRPNGTLYASFKYGTGERVLDGRRFTDMTEVELGQVLRSVGFSSTEYWITDDVRPGKTSHQWLNALARS
jgi:DNA polymerase family A/AAA domain